MSNLASYGAGSKEHGSVTVGVTPVLLQAATVGLRSLMVKNKGTGVVSLGGPLVTTANSAAELDLNDVAVFDQSSDDTWAVSTIAGTTVTFLREMAP